MKVIEVRKRRVVGLAAAALAIPSLCLAETGQSSGWFIEAEIIDVHSSVELSEFVADGDDTGYVLGAGFAFGPYFEVAASYRDLGEYAATDCPPPRLCLITNVDRVDFDSFEIAALGKWPVANYLDLFAKAGIVHWDADFREFSRDRSDNDLVLGAGFEFRLADRWRLTAEYTAMTVDLQTYGVGLGYRF